MDLKVLLIGLFKYCANVVIKAFWDAYCKVCCFSLNNFFVPVPLDSH